MKLKFKATNNYKVHYDLTTGVVRDGDVVNVPDKVGEQLLADYPQNFAKVTGGTVQGAKTKVVDERSETVVKASDEKTEPVKKSKIKRTKKRGGK